MPFMVMRDGNPQKNLDLAQKKGLNFPVVSDPSGVLFERWDPTNKTPSTTLIRKGVEVFTIDEGWHTESIKDMLGLLEED